MHQIYPRRTNAEEVLITQKDEEFMFPVADGTARLSGRDYDFRETTPRGNRPQGAKVSVETFFKANRESLNWQTTTDDAEACAALWSTQGDFIYRHHEEPRVQLFVPKEETFPFPLKYIDVTGSTYTDLDVMQEKRVDDYWNVDSNRS